MKLPNDPFQQALRSIASIAHSKANGDDIFNLVKLEADKGLFRMSANESGQYAVAEMPCTGSLEPICVASHSLQTIGMLFDDSVSMDLDGTRLKIKSKGDYSLATQPASQFTSIPTDKLVKIGVNCADLAECVDGVKFAMRKTDDRSALYGVNVRLSAKNIITEASTGHLMGRMEKASIAADARFLIPAPFVANAIAALRQDGAVLSLCDSRILVEFDGGCYSCTLMEAQFPNMDSHLNEKRSKLGEFNPKEWLPVFRTVLAMAGEEGKLRCDVKIKDGVFKYDNPHDSVNRTIDKLAKALHLNASLVVLALEAFDDGIVKASVYESLAVRLEQGDLTVLVIQLRG